MYIRNIVIGVIAALFSLFGFMLSVWPNMKLTPNLGVLARIGSALMTGLGFLIFFIIGTVALDYLGSPDVEKSWNTKNMGGLICFALPGALLVTLGSLIWYSGRIATQKFFSRRLSEIIQKSKKQR